MSNLAYIQVVRKCNQSCLFCSNPENDRILELEQAQSQIERLSRQEKMDGVILTGGEPTLHPRLAEIVQMVNSHGLHVRVITNGQLTASKGFLMGLKDSGLGHIHVSVYSFQEKIQAYLSNNENSLINIKKTLENIGRIGIVCDINTVMCAQNADHLDQTIGFLIDNYPFINHFIFNAIDPKGTRVAQNPHTIARLADLELSLNRALEKLETSNRTYRVERLPLCYMANFAFASTETRKIVKQEGRIVQFLDDKGEIRQERFFYSKVESCRQCSLNSICAGLFDLEAYDPKELHAIFLDPEPIKHRILKKDK